LNPETAKWKINQTLVKAHVDQLEKAAEGCQEQRHVVGSRHGTAASAASFRPYVWREPAFCFGREHLDEVLDEFGGVCSWLIKQFLPGGLFAMMKQKRVTWQMVL